MATEATANTSLTRKEVDRQKASLELDLIAFFKEMQSEVFQILEKGERDNWTPDEIIAAMEELFEG